MPYSNAILAGPPGPPAGLYPDDYTVTSRSVRLVWTTSNFIHHGGPITQYDFEAETNYNPGEWRNVASGKPIGSLEWQPIGICLSLDRYTDIRLAFQLGDDRPKLVLYDGNFVSSEKG